MFQLPAHIQASLHSSPRARASPSPAGPGRRGPPGCSSASPAAEAPAAGWAPRAAAAASATWTPMGSATRSARGLEGRRPTAGARVCKTADVSIARSDAGVSKPRTCGRGGAPRRPRPPPPRRAAGRVCPHASVSPKTTQVAPRTPSHAHAWPSPRTFPRVTHV